MSDMIQLTIWELIGAIFIIVGILRLLLPEWVRKKKLTGLQKLMTWCKKVNASSIRIIGLILIIIGILLIYYL